MCYNTCDFCGEDIDIGAKCFILMPTEITANKTPYFPTGDEIDHNGMDITDTKHPVTGEFLRTYCYRSLCCVECVHNYTTKELLLDFFEE